MVKIKKTLDTIILRDRYVTIFTYVLSCIGIAIYVPWLFVSLFFAEKYFWSWIVGILATIIFLNIALISATLILYQIWIAPFRMMWSIWRESEKVLTLIKKGEWNIWSINEILNNIELIRRILKKFLFMKQLLWFFLTRHTNYALNIYVETTYIEILTLLTDLQNDLKLRMDERQKILESAKSEVMKNIQWTTELNKVSELQRTRLDRQIEQFEALQRVLMKV